MVSEPENRNGNQAVRAGNGPGESRLNWDWRKANEDAGLLKPDDCRNCSGMGRVPHNEQFLESMRGLVGFEPSVRYTACPQCGGTGKQKSVTGEQIAQLVEVVKATHEEDITEEEYQCREAELITTSMAMFGPQTTWTPTFDESQRQMLLLGLHKLRGERPGWDYALKEVEAKLGGQLDWPPE